MSWFGRRKKEPFLSAENLSGNSQVRPAGSGFEHSQSRFSLTVEELFVISGRGTVVTGKVASGRAIVGDRVTLLRTGSPVGELVIQGIETFGKTVKEADAGQSVGIVLGPHVKVVRGDELRALSTAVER